VITIVPSSTLVWTNPVSEEPDASGTTWSRTRPEVRPRTSTSISHWVAQADRDAGRRTDGLTTAERTELTQLRRDNRQLKLEREILSKAAAWFAQETAPNTKRSSGS
jgi:transposase